MSASIGNANFPLIFAFVHLWLEKLGRSTKALALMGHQSGRQLQCPSEGATRRKSDQDVSPFQEPPVPHQLAQRRGRPC